MLQSLKKIAAFARCAARLGTTPVERWQLFWRQTKNARVRLGLGRHHPGDVFSLRTRYGTLYFRDNFGDITNLVGLYCQQVYRPRRLNGPGVIVDVGANIGLAAALFAHYNPERPIYCFEPLPDNARMIRMNCPRAVVEEVALGEAVSRVALRVDPDSVMATTIDTHWDTREQAFEVTTLDRYATAAGIDEVAFLKIDAEGMELDILRGGRDTLGRARAVAMETHGEDRHIASLRLLEEAGLSIDGESFDGATGLVHASRRATG